MIAFYYLLRVGEYTAPKRRGRQPKNQQCLVNDVNFFTLKKTCGFLFPTPLNASRQDMSAAVTTKLRITGQKNSFKGACVHHGALEGKIFACPVNALARRVAHIWVHTSDGTALLCAYWDSVGRADVTDRDMSFHMKFAASKLGYPSRSIPLDRIDTHSNRAGGVCEIKFAGFNNESIRKMGIWLILSNDFLEYIQQHLSGFSQGVANKMSRIARFTSMEGSANHTG